MANLTLAQIKDALGDPIILLMVENPTTKQIIQFTDKDLSPAALAALVAWINSHLP